MARKAKAKPADALAPYLAKRDFSRTTEPRGGKAEKPAWRFVVQKHDATRLHYDFRLELDGVLKSWAVTRGPSANPADKRLAVRTEDHPIDYGSFEGLIPKGQYGGGTVMLWDRGNWTPVPGKDPRKTLAEGHLHFTLDGERMKGEWLLIRLKPRKGEKRENWLLRKIDDAHTGESDDLVAQHLTSVASGRTMAQIADGKKKRAKSDPPPPFRAVALARLMDRVPEGSGWLHEMKYDGYRTLIAIGDGTARAYTRSGLDWSDRFAALLEDAAGLPVASALIDGEAVVLDKQGRSRFQALQAALKDDQDAIIYFAFDLLELDGKDLTTLPLIERKAKLAALLGEDAGRIRYSDHIEGHGEKLLKQFCAAGLEGVVSKRAASKYVGARTGEWVKTKCLQRQEFVIVGWLPSERRRGFRSLLLGVHENGGLRYAGKAGTGFSDAEMARLLALMKPLQVETPPVEAPRAAVRGAQWVKPKLVAEIAFAEITADGVLRHSSYVALREDKKPTAVVRETAAPADQATVRISNRDRVIFPEAKITKGELADYYAAVAPIMLAWVGSRPISLVRCPQGRARKCFFQKHDAGSFGEHVQQLPIREKDGGTEAYLFIDSAEGLAACVQMGTIELHGWGARVEDVEKPDRLVFDLDPDEGLAFTDVVSAALHVRDRLAEIGLASFAMTTGGKGVHVIAPLMPAAEWPAVKDFAQRFATALAQAEPDRFTAALAKAKRKGRIFIDYLRNQRGSTAVMPYSARARAGAPVAVPVTWEELRTLDSAANWHIGDAKALLKRAGTKALLRWGRADQTLPDA